MTATLNALGSCIRCHVAFSPRMEPPVPGYGRHEARGLCTCCVGIVRRAGELALYPTTCRSADDVLDDWVVLRNRTDARGRPLTTKQAAERMGITRDALMAHLLRARRRNDPRALLSLGERGPYDYQEDSVTRDEFGRWSK